MEKKGCECERKTEKVSEKETEGEKKERVEGQIKKDCKRCE
jgi:hypothetical protein